MKIKQKYISGMLGISQPAVSMIMTGEREISWPIADKLFELFSSVFPEKTIKDWKNATPEDLRRAFQKLEEK